MAEPEARPVAATKEGSDSNSPAYSPTPRTFFFYYFFFFSTTFSLWPWLFIAFVLSANASKCRSHTVGEIHPSCAFNLISSFSVLCGDSHCRIHHSCMYYAFIPYILLVFSLCYNWKEINIQNSSGSRSTDYVFFPIQLWQKVWFFTFGFGDHTKMEQCFSRCSVSSFLISLLSLLLLSNCFLLRNATIKFCFLRVSRQEALLVARSGCLWWLRSPSERKVRHLQAYYRHIWLNSITCTVPILISGIWRTKV